MSTKRYWDWTLDASDLAASPIWDDNTGFGGDGDLTGGWELFSGGCVSTGPFANESRHWHAKFNGEGLDILESPHCLTRGFSKGDDKESYQRRITAEVIEEILSQPTYGDFFDALEVRTHNAIPRFINGDWEVLTVPNGEQNLTKVPRNGLRSEVLTLCLCLDPVFFLHHTQVDRLWWIWQQRNPGLRMSQYQGPTDNIRLHANATGSNSTIEDVISLGTLAQNVYVKDMMSTQSDLLCYGY